MRERGSRVRDRETGQGRPPNLPKSVSGPPPQNGETPPPFFGDFFENLRIFSLRIFEKIFLKTLRFLFLREKKPKLSGSARRAIFENF